jgi:hypothetical protein
LRADAEQTTNTLIEGRSDLQKWQQQLKEDFDTSLSQLGYEELRDGSVRRKPNCVIICNEQCIVYLKSVMTPFYFRSVSITKLDRPQINMIIMVTMQKMTVKLDCFAKEFEIPTTADVSTILLLVENILNPILFRSIDGFTKKEDSGARKIIEDATGRVNEKEGMLKQLIKSIA